jgi:hypothetical protein
VSITTAATRASATSTPLQLLLPAALLTRPPSCQKERSSQEEIKERIKKGREQLHGKEEE